MQKIKRADRGIVGLVEFGKKKRWIRSYQIGQPDKKKPR
jgi:hypothetical protein